MNEHVPSSKENSTFLQEQANLLREKLVGHKIFAKWRGKLQNGVLDFGIEEFIETSENLTQVKNKSSKTMGDLCVLFRILAQFKFNGDTVAFSEMENALKIKGYRMLGEDIPFEKTRPITVAIFKPNIMLKILQWMIRDDHLYELDSFLEAPCLNKAFLSEYQVKESTKSIVSMLPSLKSGCHKGRDFWNADLYAAMYSDIIGPFVSAKNEELRILHGWRTLYPSSNRACGVGAPSMDQKKACEFSAVAYTFPGEQSEFLEMFTREEQKHIATWQLSVPTAVWNSQGGLPLVGIHPESEHETWKKLQSQHCSKGVSAGLGMIMLPDNRYVGHFNKAIAQDPEQKEIRAILSM